MPRPLLTARWANLAIVSYAVPRAMLMPYVPVGPRDVTLELDTPPKHSAIPEGAAIVSLVAFEFQHCRVFGIPWPGHTDFCEMNLRFYVRTAGMSEGGRGRPASAGAGQRGVVFIREFVPKPMIAWMARKLYNEPCMAASMTSRVTQDTRTITAEYSVTPTVATGNSAAGGVPAAPLRAHTVRIQARKPVTRPGPDSIEHWFKEHRWGFGMFPARGPNKPARGVAYEVIHPTWGVYPLLRADVSVDFAALYGPDWGFLGAAAPVNVMLAAGSEVAVFGVRDDVGVRWGERVK